ncbi:hypothetical protein [uncultured Croceicoccus sp.]|uniref:hypothetical protein n=1 Tax=uncultured Croceicoccus sp. TaxID=1295329 RepID=UPI002620BD6E|nr:hypothetical protein [uncultured Croceicoccus sp.]
MVQAAFFSTSPRLPAATVFRGPFGNPRNHTHDLTTAVARLCRNARSDLFDMAADCLNHDLDEHAIQLGIVRRELRPAIHSCEIGDGARFELEMLLDHMDATAATLTHFDLDDLGDLYGNWELRLAAILLADIDGGRIVA